MYGWRTFVQECIYLSAPHANKHLQQLLIMSSLELHELPDILDETAQFTEWYTLGVYLKLSKGELDDIEKRLCSQGSKRCKIELFNLWMKTNHDASWEQLALALERCGEIVLADRIRTHHPPPPSPSAAADSHHQLSKATESQPAEPVPDEPSTTIHHQQPVPPSDQQLTTSTVSMPAAPAPVKIKGGFRIHKKSGPRKKIN